MLLEKKFEDLSIVEQIKHHEDQSGHHLEAARRIKNNMPKRRVEKQLNAKSRQSSVDSRKSTASRKPYQKKGKSKRKGGKGPYIPRIGDHSLNNFAMIPPPCLNPAIMTALIESYKESYVVLEEHKQITAWSYEAFCEGESRTPHSFYTSRKIEKDGKISYDTYVAYVKNQAALVTDHMLLREELKTQWEDDTQVRGYIYYSCVTSYKLGDTHKEGFITFLFPFGSDVDITSEDSNFVIGVQPAKIGPQLKPNQMPKDVAAFAGYFGNHIIATNVPMKDSKLTIEESDIEKIVKNLMAIYKSPTRLMRSQHSFQVQPNVNATVYKKMTFKATKDMKATSVSMQVNVPYKTARINAATEIIKAIMEKCVYQVEREGFLKAIAYQDGMKHPITLLLQRLWVACVWVLSTDICRSPMTSGRVQSLTDLLFKDFKAVFYYFRAYPEKTSWEAVEEKHGILVSGPNALAGFSASSTSGYQKAEAPPPGGAGAGAGAASMEVEGRQSNRLWDAPTTTPIDTW